MSSIIGVTGLMGSGKSFLAHLFSLKNCEIIDVDLIGKKLLLEAQTKKDFRVFFGNDIFDSQGEIIASELGKIVFQDDLALLKLNGYMHPKMKNMIFDHIKSSTHSKIVIHAALLFQMQLDIFCDLIIHIVVDEKILLNRILDRKSYLDKETILELLEKQKKDNHFFQSSDILIDNSQGQSELIRKFERLYSQFKEEIYE